MTPWYRSIRTRIGGALALGALLACLVLSWVVDHDTTGDAIHQLRLRALDELGVATAAYDFTGTTLAGATVGTAGAPAQVVARVRPGNAVTWYDGETMWAARDVEGHRLLTLRLSAAQVHEQRSVLHRALLGASLAVVAAVSLAGWFVAGSLTSRLRRVARDIEASRRREAPLSAGSARPRGDEVAEVEVRIDDLTRALGELLDRERRFSADVAHELRTPMTALVSATELLPDGEASALVRRQTQRLRRLVEDLLELARAERGGELTVEQHDLGGLVSGIVADYPGVTLSVERAATVATDRRSLERIVTNLVANALRHGAEPVHVVVDGATITVSDQGPGFPPAILRDGPRRFAAAETSTGVGLGLSIAEAWAHRLGADLRLTNVEHGAQASLRLPRQAQRNLRDRPDVFLSDAP